MRPYWAFFRTRFLALLQYRAAAIAGIGTQWLFGFVRVVALWAFYQSAGTAQPTVQPSTRRVWPNKPPQRVSRISAMARG